MLLSQFVRQHNVLNVFGARLRVSNARFGKKMRAPVRAELSWQGRFFRHNTGSAAAAALPQRLSVRARSHTPGRTEQRSRVVTQTAPHR